MDIPNTMALIFARGWQGGTVHQIASELKTSTDDILTANIERMGELLRKAQHLRNREYIQTSPFGARIITARKELEDLIDGGEECRGMDSSISRIIRILGGE